MSTKGIILACFGTIYSEALEKSVGAMKRKIEETYPDYTVKQVFLSDAVIEKWRERYDDKVMSFEEAVDEMANDGIEELFIQPFYLVADQSYQQMRNKAMRIIHEHKKPFTHINVGKPLLSSLGIKNHVDDYALTVESILTHVGNAAEGKMIVLMANGQTQLEYGILQLKCMYGLGKNIVVFTSNGFPNMQDALQYLGEVGNKDILLVPSVLIGSEHLFDYLEGERSDSLKAVFEDAGYNVTVWREGLGENPYIQEQVLRHLGQAIRIIERKKSGEVRGCNRGSRCKFRKNEEHA